MRPGVGAKIKLTDTAVIKSIGTDRVTVVAVHDSLDDDWGTDGELAWDVGDADPDRTAEWYAVVTGNGTDEWGVCSFEVES